jgi:hypothetical protein
LPSRRQREAQHASCAWRALGFEGYDDFREPFREEIRQGTASFPDRARWLQSLSKRGKLGALYADMVNSAISQHRGHVSPASMSHPQGSPKPSGPRARCSHWASASTTPTPATLPIWPPPAWLSSTPSRARQRRHRRSGLGRQRDVLIAMTASPIAAEVVEAVRMAREQGVKVIGVSDSAASPIVIGSEHRFRGASTRRSSFRLRCR